MEVKGVEMLEKILSESKKEVDILEKFLDLLRENDISFMKQIEILQVITKDTKRAKGLIKLFNKFNEEIHSKKPNESRIKELINKMKIVVQVKY